MKDILKIIVSLDNRTIGTLQMTPERDRCVFEYDKDWLANGFSISPWELPLRTGLIYSKEKSFSGGFAAFEDSMPDGYGLYLLDRMLRREGRSLRELSPLQRLSLVGNAGMGALCYKPETNKENIAVTVDDFDEIQHKALDILSEKSDADASYLYYNSHNSGGARPKAVYKSADGSNWLVKFRHIYDPSDIGKTEYQYMNTAQKCGIDIPEIRLVNDRYFSIKRFDIRDGHRIHTLTAAALLQSDFRTQSIDYANLLALTGYLTQDPAQVEQMFRRMVFNIVCINKDDHAKNFSFLCENGQWELAPAYDITYSPEGTRGEHATSVKYSGNPSLEDVISVGTGIHISRKRCLEIIEEIESVCSAELDELFHLSAEI
mgnify:FL=1